MATRDTLQRRSVVLGTSAAGLGVLLSACGDGDYKGLPASVGSLTPTCGKLTDPNIEGPFFKPDSPEKTQLRVEGEPGTWLKLEGTVLGQDCRPVAGAMLDFWHADAEGAYDNSGFVHRGHQQVDAEGHFELNTIVPGRYLNGSTYRPAHVHVKAAGPGTMLLTTQLYFPGDPYNDADPFIVDSLIMNVSEGPAGLMLAKFDFVLASA